MSLSAAIFILIVLIIVSAILSSAEISLAGARRIKLQTLANEGNIQAEKVLKLQEQRLVFTYRVFYMSTPRQNGLNLPPLGLPFSW